MWKPNKGKDINSAEVSDKKRLSYLAPVMTTRPLLSVLDSEDIVLVGWAKGRDEESEQQLLWSRSEKWSWIEEERKSEDYLKISVAPHLNQKNSEFVVWWKCGKSSSVCKAK